MKIVNIGGGLGNQMFQYAFAVVLKKRYQNEEVYVDTQHYNSLFFKKFKGVNLHNGYEINKVFSNASLPIARAYELMKISYYIPNYVLSRLGRRFLPIRKTEYISPYSMNYTYDQAALDQNGDCYYEGYWQVARYFVDVKHMLQDVFTHPEPNEYNRRMIIKLQNGNSVGIHIRRGDYLAEPEFRGICDIEYYHKGIKKIMEDGKKHTFYIFSNDMKWCKKNIAPLVGDSEIEYVTENTGLNSCWDMFLMEYCKDLIIANSSFSWWGAFLNKNVNRVIAPYPWLNRDCDIDIYEDCWIKIGNN